MTDVEPVAVSPALPDLRLNPGAGNQVAIFGRKGQGKSELAHFYWKGFPGDRVCIDVTHDVWALHPVEGAIHLSDPLPARLPEGYNGERVTIFYRPDTGSPTYLDDIDHVIGLTYAKEGTMCWVEEIGTIAKAGATRPHLTRCLNHGRHQKWNGLFTGPRPMDIDTLVLSNADVVACFDLPNPDDRRRIAASIGLAPKILDANIAALHDHEYFAYTAVPRAWAIMPPLPLRERKSKRSRSS